MSLLLGGLGMFFMHQAYFMNSAITAYAMIFLGTAACIVFSQQHGDWKLNKLGARDRD
jgi:hypothetical protein